MKRVLELFTWVVAVAIHGAFCIGQEKPKSSSSDAGSNKVAEPPQIVLVLSHADASDGACASHAGGTCESLAHWQVEVTLPGENKPAVVRMTQHDELLRLLRDAKKELEEGQTLFAKNQVVIRAPGHAPYRGVQWAIQSAGCVGLYKTEVVVVRPPARDTESKPSESAAVESGAASEPPIDDTLRALVGGGEPLRIEVSFDRTHGEWVRRIGSRVFPCDAHADGQLSRVLLAAAREGSRNGNAPYVAIDAWPSAPWGRIAELIEICKKNEQIKIEFVAGADLLQGVNVSGPGLVFPQERELKQAFVTGEGWRILRLADFVNVNGDADTWTEKDAVIVGTGKPLGGARSKQQFTNFELVLEWRHLEFAGNSGVFVWCPESAFTDLPPGKLPRSGIEVQVLDLGYEEQWLKDKGKRSDWFTSHGDVFPVGDATMQPFTPQITYELPGGELVTVGSEKGARCFPTKRLTKPKGEWNHYYIRAINGEIRLWVNGEEVSGGTKCNPARGYLALEAEGAPIEFRNLRLRELP